MKTVCSRGLWRDALGIAAFGAALLVLASCRGAESQQNLIGPWDVQRPSGASRSTLEFRLVLDEPVPGSIELTDPNGETLVLSPETVATQSDIVKTAIISSVTFPYFSVYVYFTPAAARRMHEVSSGNFRRRMGIVMDGQLFMAPTMMGPFDSPVLIDDFYTREEATRIAEQLAP